MRRTAHQTKARAPISFFDSVLMSHATDDWQKVARIVGKALATEWDDGVFQTGDLVLAARVLVDCGRLEYRGKNPLEMRFSEVRLPKARDA
ncbi:MAG: DUF3658 domain-containing protein [Croceibacterium sp.]